MYHTVPAIKKSTILSFSLIELNGKDVKIRQIPLAMDEDFITDVHCHTEYAYCGTTTETPKCIALSKAAGYKTTLHN